MEKTLTARSMLRSRRSSLRFIMCALLLATRTADAAASISSSAAVAPSAPTPSLMANSRKKRKRRRRKSHSIIEEGVTTEGRPLVTTLEHSPEYEPRKFQSTTPVLTESGNDAPAPTVTTASSNSEEGNLPRKRRRKVTRSDNAELSSGSIRKSDEEVLLPINDVSIEASNNNVAIQQENDDLEFTESINSSKTRRKKRIRRKVTKGSGQNDEEVLLPMDDNASEDDAMDNDWEHSTQLKSEESISSEMPAMQAEAVSDKIDDETIFDGQDDGSSPHPSVTVSRNETTESMAIHDDTNPDAPTTYEYTKHNEEETVEGILHTENNSDDESITPTSPSDEGQNSPVTTSIRSSRRSENIQISGGSSTATGQTVTVNVSRQQKVQSVHITTKNKKMPLSKPRKAGATSASTKVTTRSTGKGGECLRRIKREWKDAVKMGIAYDWILSRTINNNNRHNNSNNDNNDYVRIGPYGKNLLRWHFSVAGPTNSAYEGGGYHGRVLLPKDYPGSPPRVQMLTPSGRFLCGADICLSASSYHPETWTPRWTVLSLVDALRLHMLTMANEIGGVMASEETRRRYARESRSWRSPGVVDHGQMVAAEIFPLCPSEDASILDGNDEEKIEDAKSIEGNSDPSKSEKTQGASQIPSENDLLKVNNKQISSGERLAEHNISPRQRATKSAKSAKQTKAHKEDEQSQSQTSLESKTAKVAKAQNVKPKEAITTSARNGVESPKNLNDQRGILSILLKRIIIEVLKLPLRILSILLQVLNGLESRLRAILDSL